jgi:peptide/nickel transport system ATP-binding protein
MADLVVARDLVLGYGGGRSVFGFARTVTPVVDRVSLAIARGEVVGIVGESGSGKTTLGRALLGLIAPLSGTITFDGQEITGLGEAAMRPLRRRMQMIFQDPMSSLNPRHTIGRILSGPALLHGVARSRLEAERLAAETLDRVGLPASTLASRAYELSGGQRQRVGIARAIMLKPEFIVADEIVSGLDVSSQAQVLRLIGQLTREMGLSMAFISHDLSVIRAICDRVIVMRLGAIVEEGRCDDVFAHPRAAYTRGLIDAIPLPVPDPTWLARSTEVEAES